jgi:hypothetical protein
LLNLFYNHVRLSKVIKENHLCAFIKNDNLIITVWAETQYGLTNSSFVNLQVVIDFVVLATCYAFVRIADVSFLCRRSEHRPVSSLT